MTRSNNTAMTTTLCIFLTILLSHAAYGVTYPPRYHVTVLDSFEGGNTYAYALNDLGQVTGKSGGNGAPGYHAFIWQRGGELQPIDGPGWESSEGLAINNNGQVAGTGRGEAFGGTTSAVRYSPGVGMVPLDMIDGHTFTVEDMNEAGDVLGRYSTGSQGRGCLYTDAAGTIDLGALGIGSVYPRDINDACQIVGYAYLGGVGGTRSFLWENGVMQDLGTLGGASNEAYYINAAGLTVGTATNSESTRVAFRHDSGLGMQPMPLPPEALSAEATWVTDSGIIIGEWFGEWPSHRGFYYTESEGLVDMGIEFGSVWWAGPVSANSRGEVIILTHDEETYELVPYHFAPDVGAHSLMGQLNTQLDWILAEPTDINESGQILLTGLDLTAPSHYVSALLTPIERGDMNCDGKINGLDVVPFIQALTDPATYAVDHPLCADYFADISDDGEIDSLDVESFVALLVGEQ